MNWSNYDPTTALEGATTCPHCGATAKVSPDDELRFKCDVCGAPRVEVQGVQMSRDAVASLKAARADQVSRAKWRTAGLVGGVFGGLGTLATVLMLLIFGLGIMSGMAFTVGMVPWLALAALAIIRSKGKTTAMMEKLDDAWRLAARDVLANHPDGLTASELGEKLGLTERQTDLVAAELSLDGAVQSRITDDGRQVLTAPKNLRIQPQLGGDPLAERFQALEESMAAEEAAAAEGQKKQMKY